MFGLMQGCIPFAIPPGQASIAGSGSPARSDPGSPDLAAENEVVLRGAIHPQQLFRSQATREIDVGAGWRVDLSREPPNLEGPYAEVSYLPWQVQDGSSLTRLGLLSFGEILYRPGSERPGWGATLALSAEITTFVSGTLANGSGGDFVAAAAHGEVGVGVFAGVTHRELERRSGLAPVGDTLLTAGISGRLPATAGIICCIKSR